MMSLLAKLPSLKKAKATSLAASYDDDEPVSHKSKGFDWVSTHNDPQSMRRLFESDKLALKSIQRLMSVIDNQGDQARRIGFISSEGGMEASAMTISLGRRLAQSGLRVVALDMAVNNSYLSNLITSDNVGLCDALRGTNELSEVIHGDDKSSLNLIPLGNNKMTLEALHSHRDLAELLDCLSMAYDRVLIDFGAITSRFFADKIMKTSTSLVLVGSGTERHQTLFELFEHKSEEVLLTVMMADSMMDERLAA